MSRELYFWFKQFHRMGSCPGADFMKSLLLQLYKFTSLLEGRGARKQLITFSINIHSILYLNSLKIGWAIESYYMKTVIWVSHLVQCKYQRLLKWSFQYVVRVDGNWKLTYKKSNRVLPPSSSPSSCTSFTQPLFFSEHLVYFVFLSHTHSNIDIHMHLTVYGPLLEVCWTPHLSNTLQVWDRDLDPGPYKNKNEPTQLAATFLFEF